MSILRVMSRVAACVLLAAACGGNEQPAGVAPAPAGETAASAEAPAAATPAASVPAAVPPAAGVIASTEGETSGVRIDVTQFQRASGDTVNLRFDLVNESPEEVGMVNYMTDSTMGEYSTVGGIHLVDPVNKRKYFVVRDADNKCVCSREVDSVDPGKKATLWAKFPAPPPDVQRISIVFPKFIPLDDVPLK